MITSDKPSIGHEAVVSCERSYNVSMLQRVMYRFTSPFTRSMTCTIMRAFAAWERLPTLSKRIVTSGILASSLHQPNQTIGYRLEYCP